MFNEVHKYLAFTPIVLERETVSVSNYRNQYKVLSGTDTINMFRVEAS